VRGKGAEAPSMYSGRCIKAKKNVRSEEKKSQRSIDRMPRSCRPAFPATSGHAVTQLFSECRGTRERARAWQTLVVLVI